jgi:hypothetical protein
VPPEAQKIHVEAVCDPGTQWVNFWMDGKLLIHLSQQPYETWWQISAGQHQVWAEAQLASGEVLSSPVVSFEVLDE